MNCEDLIRCLSDYIDQGLDHALAEAARAHLQSCPNCRVVLDTTRQTIRLFRQQGQARTIPIPRRQALFRQLAAALDARSGPPRAAEQN